MNRIKDELAKRNRIRQQVLKIRNTGEANMFDVENVKWLNRLLEYWPRLIRKFDINFQV